MLRELSPAVEQTIAETQRGARRGVGGARATRRRGPAVSRGRGGRGDRRRGPGRAAAGAAAARAARLWPSAWRAGQCPSAGSAQRRSGASPRTRRAGVIELGGGVEAQIEQGHIRFRSRAGGGARGADPAGSRGLPLRALGGASRARRGRSRRPMGSSRATLDPGRLGGALVVRSWRDGDRIRPLGLGGTKSLQDLFTDRKVPRSLRRTLPVVTAGRPDRLDRRRRRLRGVRGVSRQPSGSRSSAPSLVE